MKTIKFKFAGDGFFPQPNAAERGPVRRGVITIDVVNVPDETTVPQAQTAINGTWFPFAEEFWASVDYTIDYSLCRYGAIYPHQDARLIDAREIAEILGYKNVVTATNLARSGKLKSARKFGNSWTADRLEVEEYKRWTESRKQFGEAE